jgi:iron complex transport system ATP-binding protein
VVSVLHDLPLALHADRLLVMRAGVVRASGEHDDPALHAVLVDTFDNAVRIDNRGARPMALPHLGD